MNNVLVVINDKKIPEFNILDTPSSGLKAFNADVLTYSDYYPFCMIIDARHRSKTDYRYGFQGQEMDNEIKGEGNSLNYTFRMHDPRVGRFFAVDPLEAKYPWYSPHQFSGNRVIDMVELEGLEPASTSDKLKGTEAPTTGNFETHYPDGSYTGIPAKPFQMDEIYIPLKDNFKGTYFDKSIAQNGGSGVYGPSTDWRYSVAIAALPLVEFAPLAAGAYEGYSAWYASTSVASYFAQGTSTIIADLFTVNSLKSASIGFMTTSGGQYLASGFDINSITVKKNAITSPIGGFGGLLFKSSFQQDKNTGNFRASNLDEFALDFSFGKMSDQFGSKVKAFKLPKYSNNIGTYIESILIMGSKAGFNKMKSEVKSEIKSVEETNK